MPNRRMRLALIVVLSLSSLTSATSGAAIVGAQGRGQIALQRSDNTWKFVGAGDKLPAIALLRTAATGSSTIHLEDTLVHLDGQTELHFDAKSGKFTLARGRLQLKTATRAWSISLGEHVLQVNKQSYVVLRKSIDDQATLTVLAGDASIRRKDKTTPLSKGDQATFGAKNETPKITKLQDRELHSASDWIQNSGQGLGQLLVKDAQSDQPRRLQIARYHVNVVLRPPVALVQIDQSFYNPYGESREGTFLFNLPPGASVSRFGMYVTKDELIDGELMERGRARNIYQTIVSGRRDPAILEEIGDNLFQMRVFPIFA